MPRRNLVWLTVVGVVSLVCYQKVQRNRYGWILAAALDEVQRRFVEPVESKDLFEGAMQGMVERLDDPNSSFFSPRVSQEFHETIEGRFGGVGMEVSLDPKTKQLTVMSPLVGTPAYEAGIRAGDKILRIDDQSTQGLSLQDAVSRMRGEPGEPVVLSVLHEGDREPVRIEIVRAIIRIETVLGDGRKADGSWDFFLEGHDRVGYLRISKFAENTVEELQQAMDWLIEHDMQALIVDLRDDPGGLLDAAIEVCDMFVDFGVIVTIRGRDKKVVKGPFEAGQEGTFTNFPMAVLVNQYSASASEIVAACLQDHGRAVVVGQRTWGKGTVQDVIDLENKAGTLKLTTATYWRPSGRNIHRASDAGEDANWGVAPDPGYKVVVEGEELARLRLWRMRRDVHKPNGNQPDPDGQPPVDRQLAKAVEAVRRPGQ